MSKQTILIVEDDKALGQALKVRLQSVDYHVILAADAYAAVQAVRKNSIDLVLLDISMPAGDGFKVHESISRFSDFAAPVVYLSGSQRPKDIRRAKEMGAIDFVIKPVDPFMVMEKIPSWINNVTENQAWA